MSQTTPAPHVVAAPVKPRLRGWLHAAATPLVLAAGIVLIVLAPTTAGKWAAAVYTVSALVLFGTSAIYHTGSWSLSRRRALRRMDHANIYLIIAGTYTPAVVAALEGGARTGMLIAIWVGAVLGVFFQVFWIDSPRWLSTGLYIALGWSIIPFVGQVIDAGLVPALLIMGGGVLYTLGAVVYGLKKPDPSPTWFGFHEVFHSLTIAAWAVQYVAILLFTLT